MTKVHVVLKKEEVNEEKMAGKIAVVLDILLATSTITSILKEGAKEVIPVLNGKEAREVANALQHDEYVLVGEYEGKTIEGFLDPNPSKLKENIIGKTVILSTTNGTVAIRKSSSAKVVFAASLLNSEVIARTIVEQFQNDTVVIVCSGSSDAFSLEDFYGAGCFLHCLKQSISMEMTDAARAALLFYEANCTQSEKLLQSSTVGKMLLHFGYGEEISFINRESVYDIVPRFQNGKIKKGERLYGKNGVKH